MYATNLGNGRSFVIRCIFQSPQLSVEWLVYMSLVVYILELKYMYRFNMMHPSEMKDSHNYTALLSANDDGDCFKDNIICAFEESILSWIKSI